MIYVQCEGTRQIEGWDDKLKSRWVGPCPCINTTPSCMGKPNECREKILQMLKEVLKDTMRVFDFGAQKHPDSGEVPNFLTSEGNKCSLKERGSSVLRHAARTFMHPESIDDESKLNELLHLMASTAILYIRQKRNIIHPEDV